MTLSQLRYVVALDQHRSFGRAAAAVHVSQPALSMQVRRLEELLGARLFDRSKQPVLPTELGKEIVEQARRVLRETTRLGVLAAEGQGELSGEFRLGVIPTLASTLLPLLVPAFTRAHPDVRLIVVEEPTESLVQDLAEDRLDAALASTPLQIPGLHERPVLREPLWLYLPSDHRLLRRKSVRQADVVDERVWLLAEGHCLGDQVLHLCKIDVPRPGDGGGEVVFRGGSLDTLRRLVDAGMGVTVLPQMQLERLPARARRRARPFAAPEPVREVSLVYARTQLRQRISDAVFDRLRAEIPAELCASRRRQAVLDPLPER